jgi:WD40 repeat protein
MENGSALIGYPAHQAPIQSVCLSEDGRFALSATRLGTVKIWNVRTGQCLRSFRGFGPVKLGRDGRFAICAGFNGVFQILAVHCDEPPLAAPHVICRDT